MKRSVWLPLAVLAVITAIFGVITALNHSSNPSPTPTPSTTTVSFDGDWFLFSGTDADGTFDDTLPAVRMSIADGQLSGQICNSWGGDVTVDGSTISIGALVSTEMYCTTPKGIMDLESRFLTDLPLVTTITVEDGRLHLTGGGVDLVFGPGY
ncbi:MAG: hypothetical protein RLZZ319_316 [Actinomycetota bacterium]|jgi:heat shock protein HslJ